MVSFAWRMRGHFRLTEQTQEVLSAVDLVQRLFAILVDRIILVHDALSPLAILASLLLVQQDSAESQVEVFANTLGHLVENGGLHRAGIDIVLLKGAVFVEKLADRILGWERNHLIEPRHILPIVHENALENVWERQANLRLVAPLIDLL